jgi:NAD(P)-dependent dehydrogenase (short-subunit alcohol dehydrogenase family)
VPTVLISGASSGIGRATALRLAGSGWTVLAGVRDPAVGEALAVEAGSERVVPLALDITNPAQVAAAAEFVQERTGDAGLNALINNAGAALGGPLEMLSMQELRDQFEVNFFGHIAMTQALIPALRRAGTQAGTSGGVARPGARLLLVSSIGGLVTTPYLSPYCASKYALEAVGDALRVELARSHIQVALIEPGSIVTPIWDKGNELLGALDIPPELDRYYGQVPAAMGKTLKATAARGIPPERVAQTIEGALGARRMRARYLIGVDARGMSWLKRLLPDHVLDRVLRRALGV